MLTERFARHLNTFDMLVCFEIGDYPKTAVLDEGSIVDLEQLSNEMTVTVPGSGVDAQLIRVELNGREVDAIGAVLNEFS